MYKVEIFFIIRFKVLILYLESFFLVDKVVIFFLIKIREFIIFYLFGLDFIYFKYMFWINFDFIFLFIIFLVIG